MIRPISPRHIAAELYKLYKTHPNLGIILYWPTASGKTALSLQVADYFAQHWEAIEIISADSRQLYRQMDIWTDKLWKTERQRVPHHLIDSIDPDQHYTAYQRQQDTKTLIKAIQSRKHIPMIVWWSWLYIDTIYKNFELPPEIPANWERRKELLELEKKKPGYLREFLNRIDPESAKKLHPNNDRFIIRAIEIYEETGITKSRMAQEHPVDLPLAMVSLESWVEEWNERIRKRVEQMLENWLIEEVKHLLAQWYSSKLQSMNGIGYRQTIQRLLKHENELSETEAKPSLNHAIDLLDSITLASTRYAKRQRTWFRRYQHDAKTHPKENVFYYLVSVS